MATKSEMYCVCLLQSLFTLNAMLRLPQRSLHKIPNLKVDLNPSQKDPN